MFVVLYTGYVRLLKNSIILILLITSFELINFSNETERARLITLSFQKHLALLLTQVRDFTTDPYGSQTLQGLQYAAL